MHLNGNDTSIDFTIIGFSDFPNLRIPLMLFFLSVHILTLTGNFTLILLILRSPSLYTPMYFFLANLSFLDIVYTSVTSPKLISVFVTQNGRISFHQCIVQLFFFIAFWNTEYFLLTVMSYDRYVAICKPLHYTLIMNRRTCRLLAMGTWLGGVLGSVCPTIATSSIDYCSTRLINHLFCDITALEKLACDDASIVQNVIFVQASLLVMTAFMLTLISYIYIIITILKIRSTKGKYKAFSTCASHLTVVSVFYTLMFDLYVKPKSEISLNKGKMLTVVYAYMIPMLNPVIYSFRNKDVLEALRKFLKTMLK